MPQTEITFREFTRKFIKGFPEGFRYLKTPVQVYDLQTLLAGNIITPTPLLKANFNYIVFIKKGRFSQLLGNEIRKVAKHQALLVMQGEVSALLQKSTGIQGYYITFNNAVLQSLEEQVYFTRLFTTAPVLQLSPEAVSFAAQLIGLLMQELGSPTPDKQLILWLFKSLLLKLLQTAPLRQGTTRSFDIAIAFRKILYKQFTDLTGPGDYARQLCISPGYLNRCVQSVWGKSARQAIGEFTLIQSQQYLQDFTKSVAEVAYELNFKDPSYFSRLFKKMMGVSPQQYRAALMHDLSGQ